MYNTQTMSYQTPSYLLRLLSLAFILPLLGMTSIFGQSPFEEVKSEQVAFSERAIHAPVAFAAHRAADAELRVAINKALQTRGTIEIPLPSGELVPVQIQKYEVAEKEFYRRYPQIQTFSFQNAERELSGFGAMSQLGFHAVGQSTKGEFYTDPTQKDGKEKTYATYFTRDYALPEGQERAVCEKEGILDEIEEPGTSLASVQAKAGANQDRPPLRQYRFAVATTGEYAQYHGGTKEDIAAELVNLMIRVNEVMRREFSVEYILIDNTDTLFFLDPDLDGFTNGNTSTLISQVNNIIPQYLDDSEYDLGHVLCTNAGGLATVGAVCSPSRKRRGVSCSSNPIGDRFYVGLVCHEMGHQMGSRHSFNHCRGENENLPTGFEPGSGSTIMSYAGLCGARNVANVASPYYNIGSLQSIVAYMHEGQGADCANETERPGQVPTLEFPFDNNEPFVIPASTPFELTAGVTEEAANLLYSWEQYDAVPFNCDVDNPTGNCPLFRSLPPSTDPTRVFPRIESVINGTDNRWERLPDYTRSMRFMCTLRDWDPEGGTLDWELAEIDVDGEAGPFTVDPISGSYEVGDQIEIVWDVANTDQAPVSCSEVDIYLSEDGGFTYPHLLAEAVPNSGLLTINTPAFPTNNAKIKVKGHDNIFFNLSGSTFTIEAPTEPGFTASYPAFFDQICLPNTGSYQVMTEAILDFQEDILLADIEGLPAGASFETVPPVIQAGEDTEIRIDYGDAEKQDLRLQAVFTSLSEDTVRVELQTRVIPNNFEDLAPLTPALNEEGVSPVADFSWTTVEDALEYRLEVSLNPSFENLESSVVVESGEANLNALAGYQLETGVTYYWRIVPMNECGDGTPSAVFVLRTGAVSCERYDAIDLPKSILPTSNARVESIITITEEGTVDAVEVRNLRGTHSFVGEIRARLESPAGTEVRLFTERCFNLSDFNVNFSDLAATDLQCPLTGGNSYRPQDELSVLAGEPIQGDWKLIIEDRTAGTGGNFQSWGLELCGALSSSAPSFSKDTLYVSRGGQQFLKSNNLQAQKTDLGDFDIIYTIVDGPQNGIMRHGQSTIEAGSRFAQWAVDRWNITYEHDGSDEDLDFITFTIEDADGGWLGLDTLPIKVDEILRSGDVHSATFEVYPNPATNEFFVYPPLKLRQGELEIFTAQGESARLIPLTGADRVRVRRQNLSPGLYFIQIRKGEQRVTQKLVIQ